MRYFKNLMRNKRFINMGKQIVCIFCVFSILSAGFTVNAAVPDTSLVLTNQSIELHPNGEGAQQTIFLEGMMPEGATAKAIDVLATNPDEAEKEDSLPLATDQEPEKSNLTTKSLLQTKQDPKSVNISSGITKNKNSEYRAATESEAKKLIANFMRILQQ